MSAPSPMRPRLRHAVPGTPEPRELAALAAVASAVAERRAKTRAELAASLGWSRSTVAPRVDRLVECGVLVEEGSTEVGPGRPPRVLSLNAEAGVIAAVDLGARHVQVAITDLAGEVLSVDAVGMDVADGPLPVLEPIAGMVGAQLLELSMSSDDVAAIGVGLPGPVDHRMGAAIRPPIMPGWDGFPIPRFFAGTFEAPVVVDNDVNLMAVGEYAARRTDSQHLLFVKIGTGIGCGIISGGRLHRGADGAAGDIGHIRLAGTDDVVCHCGNLGCLEASASGAALARILSAAGLPTANSRDVVALTRAGNPVARRAVRVASKQVGEVIAGLVNFHNPEIIVVGGALAELNEDLLAGIREVIYRRALPLATRELRVETSELGAQAALRGAAAIAREVLFTAPGMRRWL